MPTPSKDCVNADQTWVTLPVLHPGSLFPPVFLDLGTRLLISILEKFMNAHIFFLRRELRDVHARCHENGEAGRLSRLTWGPEAAVVLVEKTSSCSAASFKDEDRCINEHMRDPRWSGDGPAVVVISSGDLLSLGKHFVASSDECKKYLPAAASL